MRQTGKESNTAAHCLLGIAMVNNTHANRIYQPISTSVLLALFGALASDLCTGSHEDFPLWW